MDLRGYDITPPVPFLSVAWMQKQGGRGGGGVEEGPARLRAGRGDVSMNHTIETV